MIAAFKSFKQEMFKIQEASIVVTLSVKFH